LPVNYLIKPQTACLFKDNLTALNANKNLLQIIPRDRLRSPALTDALFNKNKYKKNLIIQAAYFI
jgi:hypothetical protein